MYEDMELEIVIPRLLDAVRGKKTAKGISYALYRELCKLSDEFGQKSAIEVRRWSPAQIKERNAPHGKAYVVSWEAGPYDWAVVFSMCGEVKRLMEPYYSFDLCIYPNDDGEEAA